MAHYQYPYPTKAYLKNTSRQVRAEREALRASVQDMVDTAVGPFLEVAGPSENGFVLLDGVQFKQGLITSNYFKDHADYNVRDVDLRLDVRRLPFAAKSLGGVIVSYLTKTPVDIARAPGIASASDYLRIHQAEFAIHEARERSERGDYSMWEDARSMNEFQRLAFMKQSRQVLKYGGLLLMRGYGQGEIELAQTLGFETRLSVLAFDDEELDETHRQLGIKQGASGRTEALLELAHPDTPAGRFIESLSD